MSSGRASQVVMETLSKKRVCELFLLLSSSLRCFLQLLTFRDSSILFIVEIFPDFEALLRTYPASKIENYQKSYALRALILRKFASERLVEQEDVLKKMSRESKKLKREFNLA
jgi:hypothetical protein